MTANAGFLSVQKWDNKQFCCGNTEILDQSPPKILVLPVKAQHCYYVWCVWVLRHQPSNASLYPWVTQLCWQKATVWAWLQHWSWNWEAMYTLYTNKLYTNTNIKNIRYVYIFFSLMFFSWPENKINILTIVMMYASSVKKNKHVRCYPESQQVLHVWTSVQLLFISFLYILCPSDCSYGLWLPDKMQKLTLAL